MKKKFLLFVLIATVLFTFVLTSCGEEESDFEVTEATASIDYSPFAGTSINVYNWGEYIADGSDGTVDVNKEFTRLTGIEVNYTNYTSNEDMYSKMKSGGMSYDVIIPSDYMIEQLIRENLVQKINFENVPNYKYIAEEYKNLPFDPTSEYSIPYAVGTVGIIYNQKMVDELKGTEGYTPDSWDILWDKDLDGKILMFGNERDAFAIAEAFCGISLNENDKDELKKAQEKLVEQKSLVKAYVMDEVFNKMESGSAAVAPYYAGDFFTMYENNEDLAFAYPKEGFNIFVDSICIPASSKNKAAAELYINFLLDPNVALEIAETICYTCPNTGVTENEDYKAFLADMHEDAEVIMNDFHTYFEGKDENDFYFRMLGDEARAEMTDLWNSLKIATTEESGTSLLLIICIAIVAALVVLFVIAKIRKKKRESAD